VCLFFVVVSSAFCSLFFLTVAVFVPPALLNGEGDVCRLTFLDAIVLSSHFGGDALTYIFSLLLSVFWAMSSQLLPSSLFFFSFSISSAVCFVVAGAPRCGPLFFFLLLVVVRDRDSVVRVCASLRVDEGYEETCVVLFPFLHHSLHFSL
jgi:hypothetical protein